MWARSVLVVGPTSARAQTTLTSPFWSSRHVIQPLKIARTARLSHSARNRNAHSLIIVAHGGGHSHSHSHTATHDHEHTHAHHDHEDHDRHHHYDHEHDDHGHVEGFGHSHSDNSRPANRLHGFFISLLHFTRLQPLLHWLEGSIFSSIAKILLFLAAAGTSWAAGSAGRDAAAAATLRFSSIAATAGVFFFAGAPAAVNLVLDLSALRIDTHVLMNLAVVGTLITGFPLEGALLLVLFQTSHAVEHLLTAKAQGNLQALYDAVPDHADIVQLDAKDGSPQIDTAQRVFANQVVLGDIMLVKPGTQVPLDGTIVYGRALVSVEHITGESLPSLKRQGDDIPAGALCHDGILAVKALRTAEDSTPARIARLARDAQAQRPKLRTWLENFGEIYSKLVIAATIVSLGVMVASGVPFLGSVGAERGALYRAMGLLTVASPCALVMVPLAYVSAIAAVASRGILLKGGRVLDALDGCRTVGVDKTGTLTTGRLAVTSMNKLHMNGSGSGNGSGDGNEGESVALEIAAALSLRSSHPVSDAIVEESVRKKVNPGSIKVSDFQLVAGGGVTAIVQPEGEEETQDGRIQAYFGSIDYISSQLPSETVEELRRSAASTSNSSSTVSILILKNCRGNNSVIDSIWVFTLADTVRSVSAAAVSALQRGSWAGPPSNTASAVPSRACHVVMLTGDNEASAARIAGKLGIDYVMSGLNPEDKLREIGTLRAFETKTVAVQVQTTSNGASNSNNNQRSSKRNGVIMVGDGLNDAAALAAADVGIAIASNTTAAATLAADAVVINEGAGMAAVPLLLRVARATKYVVAQNLFLAFGSIVVLAGPTVLGFMPLWLAVMLHEGSTLLVALNSLRLLRFSSVAVGKGGET
jgi:Zn2+/Cd2+-exporting ATPase